MTTSSQPNSRIDWIDAAKGACIVLVVFYHAVYFMMDASPFQDTLAHTLWFKLMVALKPLRMPLFFLISGLLAHSAIVSRPWRITLKPRLAMMLWLYVLWVILRTVSAFLLVQFANPEYVPNAGTLPLTLDEQIETVLFGTNGVWYLYALAAYFVVFKALNRWAALVVPVTFLLSIFSIVLIDNWGIRGIVENAFFFAAGCFYKQRFFEAFSTFKPKRFMLTTTMTLIILPIEILNDWFYAPGGRTLLAVFMVLAGMDACCWASTRFSLKTLKTLGQKTLPIYVMHKITILITCQFVFALGAYQLNAEVVAALAPPVAVVLNIAACLMLYRLLNIGAGKLLFDVPTLTLRRARPV
ncbi:acyltransferase family protein [Larsenimonas salina]|uniref:acyltransferase family protein n=1 Tax=Larsenimonas salina TaxID=1295565 RepID=UPI0020748674|nr:acyltransferase family protein [Larsenimonas salina]MCM5703339.1 acyltransferase family protein [Larsenimonas salina]